MQSLRKARRRLAATLARHTPFYSWVLPPAPLTMVVERGGVPASRLAVFLPGIGDLPDEFKRQGFFDPLQFHRAAIDCVAIDLHIGHFRAGQAVSRLRTDVILPARAAGYTQVFFIGVSLGGLGALLYAKEHGEEIAGVALLAPFLGDRSLMHEIEQAGGVGGWEPGTAPGNYARQLWCWLKGRPSWPPVILGYGERDTYAHAHRLLAQVLSMQQVAVARGGHDWSTWRQLWRDRLAKDVLAMVEPAVSAGTPGWTVPSHGLECRRARGEANDQSTTRS